MIGGTGRLCTEVNEILDDGMVKWGAEGVYCGTFPKHQLGIALKAEDGSQRAAQTALLYLLKRLGLIAQDALPQRDPEPLLSRAGIRVGEVRIAAQSTA